MPPRDIAPYTTQDQEPPSFSFLGTFAKFAAIGGGVIAAIAFLGKPTGDALQTLATENPDAFWKGAADTVGHWASDAATKVNEVGGYISTSTGLDTLFTDQAKKEMAAQTAAAVAGAIVVGTGFAGVSGIADSGHADNSTLPNLAAHAMTHLPSP